MTAAQGVGKAELRAVLRHRRRAFADALPDRAAAEGMIAMLADAELGGASRVALYLPHGGEVGTAALLARLVARGVTAALPWSADRTAAPGFRSWSLEEPLETGPFGTLQPLAGAAAIEPHAIVTPLLGFDHARHRLGQGAGWYDRAFARWPDARRVGLAWSAQAVDALPFDAWDVPLHAVVTEEGLR